MKDLKTVLIICEELLNEGYVDAVKEVLAAVNSSKTEGVAINPRT